MHISSNGQSCLPIAQSSLQRGAQILFADHQGHLDIHLAILEKKKTKVTEDVCRSGTTMWPTLFSVIGTTGKVGAGVWEELLCCLETVIIERRSRNGKNLFSNQHSSDNELSTSSVCPSWAMLIHTSNSYHCEPQPKAPNIQTWLTTDTHVLFLFLDIQWDDIFQPPCS